MAGALGHNIASKLGKVMMVWGEINNVVVPVQRMYLSFFKVVSNSFQAPVLWTWY